MKNDKNIEDWYRDELSKFEVNPEANGWESISSQLDDVSPLTKENVEAWYVKELEKFQSTPDKAVWNKLATRLDVANVWDRLLVSLNKYEKLIWWRNTCIKSAALLLLLWGSYYTYQNYGRTSKESEIGFAKNIDKFNSGYNNELSKKSETENSLRPNIVGGNNSTINKSSISNVNNNKEDDVDNGDKAPQLSTIVVRGEQGGVSNNNKNSVLLASNQIALNRIFAKKPLLNLDKHPFMVINNIESNQDLDGSIIEAKEFLVKKDQNKIIFNSKRFSSHFVFGMYAKRIYFGFNGGVKYQTLLVKSKENESLLSYNKKQLMDYGGSIGVTAGMIVTDKFNVEANFNFISTSGCKHEYENSNMSFINEVNLNYSTLSVLAKKMNNKSTFDNKKYSTNYIGGVYIGSLRMAENKSGGNNENIKNQFKNIDFGVVIGIEQDRYLTKELVLTPGVRIKQGFLNTSSSSNEMMNSSRNFSVEFNVGLKYIFLKKK